jgi:hypothetical protein
MRFPLGEMTVGDILDRGLKLLFARLPVFYAINLIILLPTIVVEVVGPLVLRNDGGNGAGAEQLALAGITLVAVFVSVVLRPIATAAILHIVMEEYAARRTSMTAALAFAMSRFLPLLVASFLVGVLVFIGTCLCCVPGIYFAVIYSFVGQVVVLERLGVGESLQRSQNLVTGFWWRVFGVLFLIGLVALAVQGVIAMCLAFALPSEKIIPVQGGGFRVEVNPLNHVISSLTGQLVQILFASYIAVCTTLLYLDLRIRKEGFDLELAVDGEDGDRDDRDRDRRRRDYDDDDDDYDDDDDERRGRSRGSSRSRRDDRDDDRDDDDDDERRDRRREDRDDPDRDDDRREGRRRPRGDRPRDDHDDHDDHDRPHDDRR